MKEKKAAAFCHPFAVEGRHFVYDVPSNEVLAVEPPLAAVLPLVGPLSAAETAACLAGRFSAAEVAAAIGHLERARDEGLLRAERPRIVPPEPEAAPERRLGQLILTVTERCNLRCCYCLHGGELAWIRPHGNADMPWETARAAVDYYLERAEPEARPAISFYGGEPLLVVDLLRRLVAHVRRHRRGAEVLFAIDTNGVLLDAAAIDWVLAEGVRLQVSLDGPADLHDRCRVTTSGAPTFARLLANLDRLLARDPRAASRLSFIGTLAPPTDIERVCGFFADFPPYRRAGIAAPPAVRLNPANLQGLSWSATAADYAAFNAQLDAARERYAREVLAGGPQAPGPGLRALFEPDLQRLRRRRLVPLAETFTPGANCRPGRQRLHVGVGGGLQPCERTGRSAPVGQVRTGLDAAAVRRLQTGFVDELADRCRECWALRLCGVCYAARAANATSAVGVPESACAAVRDRWDRALRLLVRLAPALDAAAGS